MNSKRLFYVLTGSVVIIGILSLVLVYVGNNFLQAKADTLYELKTESFTLEKEQEALVQAKKDIERYSEIEKVARTVVPQEKDQARTVREIVAIANRSGIDIANISFPSSTLGSQDKKKKAADSSTTQLEPVEGIPGVYQLEVNVQTDTSKYVPFSTVLNFLEELESNRRTSQVKTLTITPSIDNRDYVTFNVILNVYIKPGVKS